MKRPTQLNFTLSHTNRKKFVPRTLQLNPRESVKQQNQDYGAQNYTNRHDDAVNLVGLL